MEQNLEEQNQDVKQDVQQEPTTVDNVDSTNEGNTGTDQTVNQTANLEEWQKDSRYGKMWHKADDLYNSYKSLEKNFQDLSPKHKALLKVLKDNGFQAETLNDDLKKYADYRNPESRINQVYNYIDNLMQKYPDRIVQFFNQIEAEELQRMYPNMSAEQIKKQQELEARVNKFEQEARQRKQEMDYQKDVETIQKGFVECEELAKEYGFRMTDDVKNYLYKYCGENNIDPKYLKYEFWNLYGKQLREARDKKILANYNERKQKVKSAQIISGGAGKVGNVGDRVKGRASFLEGLKKIYGRA